MTPDIAPYRTILVYSLRRGARGMIVTVPVAVNQVTGTEDARQRAIHHRVVEHQPQFRDLCHNVVSWIGICRKPRGKVSVDTVMHSWVQG